jgi:hypothetical protein
VSEFSESYHLEADDQQAGIHLLQRANLDGVVFPPQGGWVTVIPRSKFGQLPDALVQANQGCLLRYLLDQDAGWMFEIFTGPQLASHYQCRWLDWSDQEGQITVDASGLDIELVQALAKRHGHAPRLGRRLERILHPRLERRTDEETGARFDGFADWEWGQLVAYAFAELVALPHYEWLRWRDDLSDEARWVEQGAVRISRRRRWFPFFWTHL